ncbi:MAG: CBS domain-containing protein [Bacteroidales bacterium]|nr:CBS domain-containing protein [Bacteroidales bacterium]
MRLVRDYMHKDITSVNEDSTLGQVIRVMKLHRLGAVPIVDKQGHCIGYITARDVLKIAIPDYIKSIYNTSFMANMDQVTNHLKGMLNEKAVRFLDGEYVFLNPTDTMSYAADLLNRQKRTILPVIEDQQQVGWITKIDIISMALDPEEENNDKHD